MVTDNIHIAHALRLAAHATNPAPNPRVGAVVLDEHGRVVGTGWHAGAGTPHAEIHALREAGARTQNGTLYVTLEPCRHFGRTPPCTQAILAAGIRRVVVGLADPTALAGDGATELRAAGVQVDFADAEASAACRLANQIWLKNVRCQLPYITLKLAFNRENNLLSPPEQRWITGEAARAAVQKMRASYDAILVGGGTTAADDPLLTVRGELKQPIRIILDKNNQLPKTAKMLAEPGETWIFNAETRTDLPPHARQITLPDLALPVVLAELYCRGVTSIFVEGGANVAHKFWAAGLVDRVEFFYGGWQPQQPLFFGQPVALQNATKQQFEQDFLHSGLLHFY